MDRYSSKIKSSLRAIMPIMPIKLMLTAVFAIVAFSSCTFEPISKEATRTSYFAKRGDSLLVNWHFNNADRVYIDDIQKSFNPIDSVKILVDGPKLVKVWAYKGNLDSLLDAKNIIISGESNNNNIQNVKNEDFTTIQRGPIKLYKEYREVRGIESEYIRGVTNSPNAAPATVKISSIMNDRNGNNLKTRIRFLVLDKYGNFINNGICAQKQLCELKYGCGDTRYTYLTYKTCRKEYAEKRNVANDILFLYDNSAASENSDAIYSSIHNSISDMAQNDRVQLVEFNHRMRNILPMKYIDENINDFSTLVQNKPTGLNSLYKSIYESLQNFPESKSNKAIIAITHYNDNSSLIYRVADLIKKSKEKQIPIYMIAVGDALQTSYLNYICTKSGGKLYHVFNNELPDISAIINEIYFAMNNYYEIEFNDTNFPFNDEKSPQPNNCEDFESYFSIELNYNKYTSPANIFAYDMPDYFQYQAVALFNDKIYNFDSDYNEVLDILAQTLKDNPNFNIELIGHSGNEGEESFNNYLANSRAEAVKTYFSKQGVPLSQIVTKSMGYKKPLYYLAKYQNQENMNRRVEVRWLDPEKFPFEIVTDLYPNENEAKNACDKWTKRGYRNYFDRIIDKGELKYEVKLWGYKTKEDAIAESKKLEAKFRSEKFKVE